MADAFDKPAAKARVGLRSSILADWDRYVADTVRDGGAPSLRRTLSQVGLQASIVYRWGRWLASLRALSHVPLAPAWLLYAVAVTWIRAAYDIRLELSADIGPGLYIGHFGGIRVRGCRIGAGCSIAQQTSIGPGPDGVGPTIGDGVWIGAHIRLQGAIGVGDNTTLAAGASVTGDVPAGVLLVGNPARQLSRNLFPARRVFETQES